MKEFIFHPLSHCHFLKKKCAPHIKQDYCSRRTDIDVLPFLITAAKYWEQFLNVTAFFSPNPWKDKSVSHLRVLEHEKISNSGDQGVDFVCRSYVPVFHTSKTYVESTGEWAEHKVKRVYYYRCFLKSA
jgi:hypothetical protein